MHHIVKNLWLGSQRDADELVRSNPETITAILNVRGPDAYNPPGRDQSAEHPGKAYKWIPAPDVGIVYPRQLKEAVLWLREQTDKGERILTHCKHGISRAPAFLAAFMVESGIASSLEEAKAAILVRRPVQPATQIVESVKPVVLISPLTGLPNRQAFDQGKRSPFVAVADVDLMKMFNEFYGPIAGDALLCRLAKILLSVRLDAYHQSGDEFLCKGESRQELTAKLSQAQQLSKEPFQIYADGRIQTIEEADFSYVIGATLEEAETALSRAKQAIASKPSPEWWRKIIGEGGHGQGW
ncbi:MAG: dual specificity protein phosphatase family protein [Terriglobales bacterium]|jgi:GGDEF domain-containing protein